MVDLARRNNFPWDAILGSEIARGFKPQPQVYLATAEALKSSAARSDDGRSPQRRSEIGRFEWASSTAHVARPQENPA
jgi:2-haloacid dehalogenase